MVLLWLSLLASGVSRLDCMYPKAILVVMDAFVMGGTCLLARAPGNWAHTLALTNERMDGADAIACGFADVGNLRTRLRAPCRLKRTSQPARLKPPDPADRGYVAGPPRIAGQAGPRYTQHRPLFNPRRRY